MYSSFNGYRWLLYKLHVFFLDSLRYIDEASESEGLMVAVKISAMECPRGSYLGIKMAYLDRRNDANCPFEWERKEDRWFTSCQCPDPNTIFRRSETEFVCVKRYVYNQGTSTGARQLCQKEGLKIIGIADQAELDALTGGIEKELCIDGTTTCTTGCTTSDYTFQDGITTSMDDAKLNYETTNGFCLYAMNGIVYAQDCDTATGSLEGSVLCGWKLTQ
ncbi:hypothetical protein L5515_015253 [Caenorhabditis briggsae]|uniref:C-type lectin domain-containing protein n=1 Tax=Caenorhabditis briggsae TaxID=6238 RepID=A0AAE9EEC5_CAEBR|nr:hypothetical protein L5515_015253 [Caenorhabditis briggsae]